MPDDEFLRQEADRNQDELVDEPIVLERQEQVGAEDDRQRPEAQAPFLPARPGEQPLEGEGEDDLRDEQERVVGNERPIETPEDVDGQMQAGLDVMRRG